MNSKIKTQTMTLEYLGDRIVYGICHPNVSLTWETELENIKISGELAKATPYLLFDLQNAKGMNQEARKNISSTDLIGATALIIGEGVSKIIGNFMIGLNKTKSPIQLFKTKEEGLAWLKTLG